MAVVSIREYARRRGVSHTAVQKAIKSQRLSRAVVRNGNTVGIDPEIADAEWIQGQKEILKDQIPSSESKPKPRTERPPPSEEVSSGPPIDKVSSTYAQSRAAREAYAARLAKLDFEQKSGKLVDAEAVRNEAFKSARIVRDALMNIPDRIAAELAAETNIFKIHSRLTEELRKSLESLSFE